jgi:hypothetical protein
VGKRGATKHVSRKTKGKQPARDRALAAPGGKGKRSAKSTKDSTSATLNVSDDDHPASFKVISPARAHKYNFVVCCALGILKVGVMLACSCAH